MNAHGCTAGNADGAAMARRSVPGSFHPAVAPRRRGRLSTLACRAWAAVLLLAIAQAAPAFDLQAHRGGRGLRPENTLAPSETALRLGVTTRELDIAIPAAGTPVISHEPALSPAVTRDAAGRWLTAPGPNIRSLTL